MKKPVRTTIDTTFDKSLLERLEKSPSLNKEEKAWLRVHSGIAILSGPDTYIDDLEDTMDTLVYLNGCASDTNQEKHAGDIERMYFTLRCLRDAFREYKNILEPKSEKQS